MSEISVKLVGDNSSFKSSMADAVDAGAGYASKLSSRVSEKLFSIRDVSHTIATAIGLNIENIAEYAARLFFGMTKEAEEAYSRISDLTEQLADQNIKAMRERLNVQQQLTLAEKDQESAQKRRADSIDKENSALSLNATIQEAISHPALALAILYSRQAVLSEAVKNNEAATKDLVKANADAEGKRLELKKQQQEIADKQVEYNKNEEEHAVKGLGYAEQYAALSQNVAEAQKAYLAAQAGSVDQASKKLDLQKAEFALSDLQLEHEKAGRLSVNQELEEALLLAKAKQPLNEQEKIDLADMAKSVRDQVQESPNLTAEERARLQVMALETQEKKNQRDIDDILKKGVENLTAADLHQLELIQALNGELDKQINALNSENGLAAKIGAQEGTRLTTETKITEEIQKQLDALNNNNGVAMFAPAPPTHEDLAQVSDEALQAYIKQQRALAAKLDPTSADFDPHLLNAGSVASGFVTEGFNQSILLNNANAAQKELDLRAGIRSGALNASNYGGDPLYFDRIAQGITSGPGNSQLDKISTQLSVLNQNIAGIHVGLSGAFTGMPPIVQG